MSGGAQHDVATAPAIAAIRAAERHQRLTPEGSGTIAALARADLNFNLIDKCACFHVNCQ